MGSEGARRGARGGAICAERDSGCCGRGGCV
ncbi:hypothetical protein E1A91_D01G049200v1 [Gossypium mustelinum]|uniref:Uncharacterized protein n=1 Tax=Gossypium mustelinum TaxID=34275 RepID=A0A5D2W3P3_GOSMU|nr:hypothetical protein E1A91_D01G049200v1 [Gossypium mustelinum]